MTIDGRARRVFGRKGGGYYQSKESEGVLLAGTD